MTTASLTPVAARVALAVFLQGHGLRGLFDMTPGDLDDLKRETGITPDELVTAWHELQIHFLLSEKSKIERLTRVYFTSGQKV
jgi:hypothetical protein